jgi:hypothetical protein
MTTFTRSAVNLFVAASLLTCPSAALADLVVTGETKSIAARAAGPVAEAIGFFLDLTAADNGGSITTGGWQIRVGLTGPNAGSDVAITGIANTVDHPQASTGLGATDLVSTTQAFRAAPTLTDFALNDLDGFVRVNLLVQPGTLGDYRLTILTGPLDTQIATAGGIGEYAYSTINGSLSVVPEPSALLLATAGAFMAIVCVCCRKKFAITSARC